MVAEGASWPPCVLALAIMISVALLLYILLHLCERYQAVIQTAKLYGDSLKVGLDRHVRLSMLSETPSIRLIEGFISEAEASHLIKTYTPLLQRSTVAGSKLHISVLVPAAAATQWCRHGGRVTFP